MQCVRIIFSQAPQMFMLKMAIPVCFLHLTGCGMMLFTVKCISPAVVVHCMMEYLLMVHLTILIPCRKFTRHMERITSCRILLHTMKHARTLETCYGTGECSRLPHRK